MKKHLILIQLALCISYCYSQVPYEYLDINNVTARVNAHPSLFWDLQGNADYSFYENSVLMSTIFAHSLWIGGKSNTNTLHLAATTYGKNKQDFYPGPIANSYNSEYDLKYNRLWKITMSQINDHIANYDNPTYIMPDVIYSWPAHGNTSNGEASYLAPFVDVNGNWYYDPQNGDYPYINGYQAIYFILNDERDVHGETNGEKLGIELHVMVYGYNCANYIIDKTVFINYKIINRSNKNYQNVYLGAFTDIDIGNANDYIGCDSLKNMYYGYKNNDYGKDYQRTSQGVYFLNKPMNKFIYINNASGATGNPTNPAEFYNYLRGRWKNGSPLTYGGRGYGGSESTNYAFPGNPNESTNSWNEVDEGNSDGDRRGLGIYGPFTFNRGEEQCLSLAFTHSSRKYGSYESIDDLKFYESHISSVFNNLNLDCEHWTGIKPSAKSDYSIFFYPNPTDGNFYISANLKGLKAIVTNINGQIITEIPLTENETSINTKNWAKGIYICNIYAEGKLVKAEKLILK